MIKSSGFFSFFELDERNLLRVSSISVGQLSFFFAFPPFTTLFESVTINWKRSQIDWSYFIRPFKFFCVYISVMIPHF